MKKKVLLIGRGYYPPVNSMGAIRLHRLNKYLKKLGWDVKVLLLTSRNLSNNKGINFIFGNNKLFSYYTMISNRLFFDFDLFLLLRGVSVGQKIISEFKPNIIYSTSPPLVTHAVGKFLSKKNSAKHIVEIRDPVTSFSKKDTAILRFLDKLERKLCCNADGFITVSKYLAEKNYLKYNEISKVIYNCYEEIFSNKSAHRSDKKIVISYTGRLYSGLQNPRILFEALDRLRREQENIENLIEVVFAGLSKGDFVFLEGLLEKYGMKKMTRLLGNVEHRKVRELQQNSDFLLLLLPETDLPYRYGIVTGKFFEYLGTGKSILVIANYRGEVYDILKKANAGCYCTSSHDIYTYLKNVIDEFKLKGYIKHEERNKDYIAGFMCEEQFRKLDKFLETVIRN